VVPPVIDPSAIAYACGCFEGPVWPPRPLSLL
jgi:hypothetical protein